MIKGWNYRVVLVKGSYGIYEVYYDADGGYSITEDPVPVVCFEDEDLKDTFELMRGAFDKPVLIWNGE